MATTTTTLIILFTVMLACNVSLAFVQDGMSEVNPSGAQFFDVDDTPYVNYYTNGSLSVNSSLLPSDEAVEDGGSNNIFTDTYKAIKSWTSEVLKPLKFAANILKQPYGFLVDLEVPQPIALAIGVFWYMIALLIIVSWWMGR